MKKLLILLAATLSVSAAFSQQRNDGGYNSNRNQSREIRSSNMHKDNQSYQHGYAYNNNNDRDNHYNGNDERDRRAEIDRVNREYDQRINGYRNDRSINSYERDRRIREA